MKARRFGLAVRRWLRLISLAVLLALAAHLIVPIVWGHIRLLQPPSNANRLALYALQWIVWAALGWFTVRVFSAQLRHFRFVVWHPPLWLVGPAAVVLLAAAHRWTPATFSTEVLADLWPVPGLATVSGAFVGLILGHLSASRPRVGPAHSSDVDQELVELDWSAIQRWVEVEQPAVADFLSRRSIADRISKLLATSTTARPRAVAVVGPLGSGKSTILEWVSADLQQRTGTTVWICRVSCWGIQDSKALAAHVLREVVDCLGSHVDTTGIRDLPDKYLRMLGSSPLGAFESLFRRSGEEDVLDGLARVSRVLEAIDARIVVYIEDAERSMSSEYDVGHLERVVWRMREVPRLSCVLALDRAAQLDVSKLCEHIERVPPLSAEVVGRVLRALRAHCAATPDIIRPLKEGVESDRLRLAEVPGGSIASWIRGIGGPTVLDAVADVVETPRRLKLVVRRVARVWKQLAGEIDLDDVIALSILRECSSSTFEFLLDNIHSARRKADQFNKHPDVVKKLWNDEVQSNPEAQRCAAIVAILGLPQMGGEISTGRVLQGIRDDEPIDYFERFLAEDIAPGELRDQEVLKDIVSWREGLGDRMLRNLVDAQERGEQYVARWEYFAWMIPDAAFKKAALAVFDRLCERHEKTGNWNTHAGFMAFWRQQKNRSEEAQLLSEDLCRMVTRALPISLRIANDLYYYWASTTHAPMSSAARAAVRTHTVSVARAVLVDADSLIKALQDGNDDDHLALRFLVMPVDDSGEPASEAKGAEHWLWMAPVLQDALRLAPDVMLPQLSRLFGEEERVFVGGIPSLSYKLNRDRLSQLFSPNVDGLANLMPAGSVASSLDAEFVRQMRAWRTEGR